MAAAPNVFSALNQMFIMGSSSTPILYAGLSQSTLQTLYIGSFFVYLVNNGADWLLTYVVGKGYVITFSPKDWVAWVMIAACTLGSIFTFLLLFLCLETAFRRTAMQVEPYRGGCDLLMQKLWGWITDMNCFRLSFLILIFEDAPMTIINFWLLNSCMVPLGGGPKEFWPQIISSATTLLALCWRVCLTFYGYKQVWLMLKHSVPRDVVDFDDKKSCSSSADESLFSVPTKSPSRYDECFPVKFALWRSFGSRSDTLSCSKTAGDSGKQYTNSVPDSVQAIDLSAENSDSDDDEKLSKAKMCGKAGCCCLTCTAMYLLMVTTCFAPCIYHYTCRKNARFHRNKCARSCVRNTTKSFYIIMLVFSISILIGLIVLNSLWLSSAYVVGTHHIPPGIRYVCSFVDERTHSALFTYEPKPIIPVDFRGPKGYCFEISDILKEEKEHYSQRYPLQNGSIYLHIARNPRKRPLLYFYYSFLVRGQCEYKLPGILLRKYAPHHPWPYWVACDQEWPTHLPTMIKNPCSDSNITFNIE